MMFPPRSAPRRCTAATRLLVLAIISLEALLTAGLADPQAANCKTIIEAAVDDPRLSEFRLALEAAKLDVVFGSRVESTTFLVPSNDAMRLFRQSPGSNTSALPFDVIVQALILPGVLPEANFTNGAILQTLVGSRVGVLLVDGAVKVAANNSATVTQFDAVPGLCSGALVHFVSAVVYPDVGVAAKPWTCMTVARGACWDADFMETAGHLEATEAELALSPTASYTLLAPDNAAWTSMLPTITTSQMPTVMKFHIIKGAYSAAQLRNMTAVETIGGGSLSITVAGNRTTIGREGSTAQLLSPDAVGAQTIKLCNNSLIHGIGSVLIPENLSDCISIVAAVSELPEIRPIVLALHLQQSFVDLANSPTGLTMLAPTLESIDAYNKNPVYTALDPVSIVALHILTKVYRLAELQQMDGQTVQTLGGDKLQVHVDQGTVFLKLEGGAVRAQVLRGDIQGNRPAEVCGGAVVHLIDNIFVPGNASATVNSAALPAISRPSWVRAVLCAALVSLMLP